MIGLTFWLFVTTYVLSLSHYRQLDSSPWHQVDFLSRQNLSGILTQGSPSSEKWVSTFTVATSNDGQSFDPVHDTNGKPIIYMSNMDRNTIARNYFPRVSSWEFKTLNQDLPIALKWNIGLNNLYSEHTIVLFFSLKNFLETKIS